MKYVPQAIKDQWLINDLTGRPHNYGIWRRGKCPKCHTSLRLPVNAKAYRCAKCGFVWQKRIRRKKP